MAATGDREALRQTNTKVPLSVREALEKRAAASHQTLGAYVREVLEAHVSGESPAKGEGGEPELIATFERLAGLLEQASTQRQGVSEGLEAMQSQLLLLAELQVLTALGLKLLSEEEAKKAWERISAAGIVKPRE